MESFYDETFAPVYNQLFTGFANQVSGPLRAYHQAATGRESGTLLDLCCGTGQLGLSFASHGYRVIGVDQSQAMIDLAHENARHRALEEQVQFIRADVAKFEITDTVDLVTCTFDSFNHLQGMQQLSACFRRTREVIADDGVFIFDVHSISGLRQQNTFSVRETDDLVLISRIGYDPDSGTAIARISGFDREDMSAPWRQFRQHATIRAWSAEDIIAELRQAGFGSAWPAKLDALGESVNDPDQVPRLFFVARP
ncbi:class I SAM-dependent methyltransferase [Nonomuraea mesophila]|uniref:Class I SAM-dependent methyltransferase n=1 Tax=Nonomuraea mesophila TaxID=2530382 RepID=A0A4V2ZB25_9ACTN|nr:class I SAM-dependent methyltransferase [Nonomuraea mesophila]TDE54653.1 class I SAM-dependent methyltransferase [Nonomuraea mesophila]